MNDPGSKPSLDEPRRRVIRDAEGRLWSVYETALSYDRRGARTLVFDGQDIVRRVRSYPADWYDLQDEALLFLSNKA